MKHERLILICSLIYLANFAKCQNQDNGTKYYEQSLKSPTRIEDARKFYNLGYIEFQKNKYYTAIDYYKKAIAVDPSYTDAIDNLALSYRRINNLDSAEKYYKISLKILPTNELAWNNLALVYVFKGDLELAKVTFRKLISVNNQYGDAYYGMAGVYLKQDNGDSTAYYGLKAYEIWKDSNTEFSADALQYVVSGYLKANNIKKAKKYYTIAKQIGTYFPSEIEEKLNK